MDPQSYSHYYHHGAQDIINGVQDINHLQTSDQSMTNYYNYPPPSYEEEERLMYQEHHHQQQHQQQSHHHQHQHHHHHHHQQQQHQQYGDVMSMHPNSVPLDNGHSFDLPPQNNPPQYPLHQHNKKEQPPPHQGVTYTCPESGCNFSANHKNSLTAHLKTHGIETPRKVHSDPSSPSAAPIHQCSECDRRYKSQGGLYWHSQTVHKKRIFSCTLCSKVYKSYPGFYLHRKTHEEGGSTERKKRTTIKNKTPPPPLLNELGPVAAGTIEDL